MKRKKIFTLLIIVLILVFLISAANIIKIYRDYGKAEETYTEMQEQYVAYAAPQETPGTTKEPMEPEVSIDFDSLLEKNSDVIGWLYCPDTVINYPVVQGADNDYYLRRGLDGKYLVSGTLFADYRNGAIGEDTNHIIYGHNMNNGTMLGTLMKYKDQTYYDQNPVLYYYTPEGSYMIELYAGLVVNHDSQIYIPDLTGEALDTLLKDCKAKSTFASDVELTSADTIITLSTCSYEFDTARYVVIGRLLPM